MNLDFTPDQLAFRDEARAWLAANHDTAPEIWMGLHKKHVTPRGLTWEDAVPEALCFGWIDGTARSVDDECTSLYFSPRRRGSVWAATNKARLEALQAAGHMHAAGLAVVERAKADGSWTTLDRSESLTVPDELALAFEDYPGSATTFASFPASARKQLIYRVDSAKRPETRRRRAEQIARLAQQGLRADQQSAPEAP